MVRDRVRNISVRDRVRMSKCGGWVRVSVILVEDRVVL